MLDKIGIDGKGLWITQILNYDQNCIVFVVTIYPPDSRDSDGGAKLMATEYRITQTRFRRSQVLRVRSVSVVLTI